MEFLETSLNVIIIIIIILIFLCMMEAGFAFDSMA